MVPRDSCAGNELIQLVVFVFGVDTVDYTMDCFNFEAKTCPGGVFDVNDLVAPFTASFVVATVRNTAPHPPFRHTVF